MVEADTTAAGVYRVFADFATAGESLTLATDVFVAGEFDPAPLPPPSTKAAAGDGYAVSLESASPQTGGASPARFTIRRDGRELDSVEPYLGADGHLVALREHDQAFLHTHPEGKPGGAGPISFQVEYPSRGATGSSCSSATAARSAPPRSLRQSAAPARHAEEAGDVGH